MAIDHAGTIQRIYAHAVEGVFVGNLVHRQVIGIGPQGELGIITHPVRERRIHLHGIEPPAAADGIAGLRHTDAL